MKVLPALLGLSFLIFGGLTAWAMTVRGIFEEASIDVGYFDAGAGDDLLLLRFYLVCAMSGLAILWACQHGTLAARLKRLAIFPGVFLILIWSVLSLDRFAPGFSEEKFLEVLEVQQKGEVLTVADVEERLGRPLMMASRADGRTIWSYSFTPSGGFGWRKRLLTFDSRGILIYVMHFDEP